MFQSTSIHHQSILKTRDAHPAQKGLPRPAKKRLCPTPLRPMRISKICGAQRGKVDFNPLKFGRQSQGRIQCCPINICLTHKSVDVCTFFAPPCPAPLIFPLPCPILPRRLSPLPRPVHPCSEKFQESEVERRRKGMLPCHETICLPALTIWV